MGPLYGIFEMFKSLGWVWGYGVNLLILNFDQSLTTKAELD